MKTENRKPIITEEVNLDYTKGIYNFFCANIAKMFVIVLSILKSVINPLVPSLDPVSYFRLVSSLWAVNHMGNKLEGISSISSSVHDNCFCAARQKLKDCICKFCYAFNQQSYQTGLKEHNILNGIILRNILIPVEMFKGLKLLFPYLRIESFGDVANVIQARNYIRIIKAFPEKRCAIWSKNIQIWKQAFLLEGKPDNTTYVHSSSKLNVEEKINLELYPFVDHVFTVFTKDFIKKHNITINCGGKKCMECILNKINCYYRNTEFYIREQKK